jgi:hypothetical protein
MDRPFRPGERAEAPCNDDVRRNTMLSSEETYDDEVANGEEPLPPQMFESSEELTTAALAGVSPARRAGATGTAMPESNSDRPSPLLTEIVAGDLRGAWDRIQTTFVDEPRQAVRQADGLVAVTMKRLAETFSEERSKLERQWDRGDEVSTEDLRLALQRYRSFFHRLLSV